MTTKVPKQQTPPDKKPPTSPDTDDPDNPDRPPPPAKVWPWDPDYWGMIGSIGGDRPSGFPDGWICDPSIYDKWEEINGGAEVALFRYYCDSPTGKAWRGGTIRDYSISAGKVYALSADHHALVYELTYQYPLSWNIEDSWEPDPVRTINDAHYGRHSIQLHDIVPGSARLDAQNSLVFEPRVREVGADAQGNAELTLPFVVENVEDYLFHSEFDMWSEFDPVFQSSPMRAYGTDETQMAEPVMSWLNRGTIYRPADWEQRVWGMRGQRTYVAPMESNLLRDPYNPLNYDAWFANNGMAATGSWVHGRRNSLDPETHLIDPEKLLNQFGYTIQVKEWAEDSIVPL